MRFRLVTWTAVIAAMALGAPAEAQVECVFDRLSTVEGLDRLDDYGFRVVGSETGLTLEQRYADGSWIAHGDVQRRDVPDFTVYEHLPLDGRGTVSVLTVHGSGSASPCVSTRCFGRSLIPPSFRIPGSSFASRAGSNAEHLLLRILLQNLTSPRVQPSRGTCSTRWRDRRCSALKRFRIRHALNWAVRCAACVARWPGRLETKRSARII